MQKGWDIADDYIVAFNQHINNLWVSDINGRKATFSLGIFFCYFFGIFNDVACNMDMVLNDASNTSGLFNKYLTTESAIRPEPNRSIFF